MSDPVFWLGLSVGLVAVAILAVILTLLPAVIQLGRAAQSVEPAGAAAHSRGSAPDEPGSERDCRQP
jgi:malonyl CoA-acyl carrier protein transacylase